MGHEGNCLEACISSLTGIPLKEFPDLSKINQGDTSFWKILNTFLQREHSMYCESITYELGKNDHKRGIIIAIVDSLTSKDLTHAILWDTEKNEMIFDPSPTEGNIKRKPRSFAILINYYIHP